MEDYTEHEQEIHHKGLLTALDVLIKHMEDGKAVTLGTLYALKLMAEGEE